MTYEALLLAALLALLAWREWRHEAERREWGEERRTLTEKAAQVRFGQPVPLTETTRVYGSDADEWRIEQARLKAGGYESE